MGRARGRRRGRRGKANTGCVPPFGREADALNKSFAGARGCRLIRRVFCRSVRAVGHESLERLLEGRGRRLESEYTAPCSDKDQTFAGASLSSGPAVTALWTVALSPDCTSFPLSTRARNAARKG